MSMTILRRLRGPAAVLACCACLFVGFDLFPRSFGLAPEKEEMFRPEGPRVPLGLPPIIWPSKNKYSPEKAELGWLLFFDKRLSADRSVACASCHQPESAFTDGQPVSTGLRGQKGARSAPTLFNCAWSGDLFWDGRAKSLEKQMLGPLTDPIEMGNTEKEVINTLTTIPGYSARFKKVFNEDKITIDQVAKALATFERTLLSGGSAYDRYKTGDKKALTDLQQEGMEIFFSSKARCDSCHEGLNFTNGKYANIGIGMDKQRPDLGLYNISKQESDKGAFKTPTLREIAHTSPYMHDGSIATLEEIVEHYDKGGVKNQWLHQDIKPLHLTPREKKALVSFLKSLSGEGWQHVKAPAVFPE
jgi:cytochrome c peroxidase